MKDILTSISTDPQKGGDLRGVEAREAAFPVDFHDRVLEISSTVDNIEGLSDYFVGLLG